MTDGLSRRRFVLASGAAAVATSVGAACSSGSDDDEAARSGDTAGGTGTGTAGGADGSDAPALDPGDWDSVRAQFRLSPDVTHFAAYVLASHPAPVRAAIARHRDGLDAHADAYIAENEVVLETAVPETAGEYLGADPGDVALTDSTTMGLGVLYGGLRLEEGDEVVTTEHDFYATHEALRLRAERSGVVVRRVALYDDPAAASVDEMVPRRRGAHARDPGGGGDLGALGDRGAAAGAAELSDAVREWARTAGADAPLVVCLDGVHGLGAVDADVGDLGVDFLAAGTHKWLFGPRGTGLLGPPGGLGPGRRRHPAVRAGVFEAWINGTTPGAIPAGLRVSPGGYHSFEHRWALAEAFRFHLDIGRAAVVGRIAEQATQLKEGLAEVDGVTVVTPADPALSAGIVCAEVDGRDAFEVVTGCGRPATASRSPYPTPYARFGPGIVTTPDEVDALVAAVADLRA